TPGCRVDGRRTSCPEETPVRLMTGLRPQSSPSLLISPGDGGAGPGVDDVARTASFMARLVQLIVDVPAVRLQRQPDAVDGEIAVRSGGVRLGNAERLITGRPAPAGG